MHFAENLWNYGKQTLHTISKQMTIAVNDPYSRAIQVDVHNTGRSWQVDVFTCLVQDQMSYFHFSIYTSNIIKVHWQSVLGYYIILCTDKLTNRISELV